MVRLPNLIVKDEFIFTSDSLLTLKLENQGTEYMYTREGKIKIYSNTHLLRTIILNDSEDQWFRRPGIYTYFTTAIRMNADAGQRRKIAVYVDPDNEIEELDEIDTMNNTYTYNNLLSLHMVEYQNLLSVSKFSMFIEPAKTENVSLAITPEYSCPWNSIYHLILKPKLFG